MATDPSSLTQMHGKVDIHCTCKLMSQCTDACMKNLMGKRLSTGPYMHLYKYAYSRGKTSCKTHCRDSMHVYMLNWLDILYHTIQGCL